MIPHAIHKIKSILDSFLGDSKRELNETYQLQYACPCCRENKGSSEDVKKNLEINLKLGVFQCWSCSQYDYNDMHVSLPKLIKLYGNETLLKEYYEAIDDLKNSDLYKLEVEKGEFSIAHTFGEKEYVKLPPNYRKFNPNKPNPTKALEYLSKRNIGWDIITEFNLGYTIFDENNKQASSRIIIPSFNQYGELNYWTGRDFTSLEHRQKYFNPQVERKSIIFNEEKIQWDADITLVEGPFDHIVVPNSIPLLGKNLKQDFKLYQKLITKANANINIFLDNDCPDDIKKIYNLLNHNRLYNKIRIIDTNIGKDPSDVYKEYGYKGIVNCLKHAVKIPDYQLFW